jgi:Protein of unknown function (DUF1566)
MSSAANRLNTFLLVLLVLMAGAIIAILANRASAGPLDPPGPPASTMHTLGDTPPSWDQVLDATNGAAGGGPVGSTPAGCDSDRFKCVMVYKTCVLLSCTVYPAVLDEETGLVWQRTPDTTVYPWAGAAGVCSAVSTANQGGWRLPTLAELQSLVGSDGHLVTGNPFTNIQVSPGHYWTSTETLDDPAAAAASTLAIGTLTEDKSVANHYWCVRGATSKE